MVPSNAILNATQDLLAQDPTTLAPAALALHAHLAASSFTPAPGLDIASLTEAAFGGYAALDAGLGACEEFVDPVSGIRIIQLNEPAGGWHWQVNPATGLPTQIFGYYVSDNADAVLYGSALLPTPITLNALNQAIDIPWIRFTFVPPTFT